MNHGNLWNKGSSLFSAYVSGSPGYIGSLGQDQSGQTRQALGVPQNRPCGLPGRALLCPWANAAK